jgi:hypothetical protein
MSHMDMGNSPLCYLDASKVQTSIGDLDGVNVCDPDDEELGSLKGVLIEAAARRVRYFVVEAAAGRSRTHCYLVPADDPVSVQADGRTLRVDSNAADLIRSGEFKVDSVRPYSDDDLMAAIFAKPAA